MFISRCRVCVKTCCEADKVLLGKRLTPDSVKQLLEQVLTQFPEYFNENNENNEDNKDNDGSTVSSSPNGIEAVKRLTLNLRLSSIEPFEQQFFLAMKDAFSRLYKKQRTYKKQSMYKKQSTYKKQGIHGISTYLPNQPASGSANKEEDKPIPAIIGSTSAAAIATKILHCIAELGKQHVQAQYWMASLRKQWAVSFQSPMPAAALALINEFVQEGYLEKAIHIRKQRWIQRAGIAEKNPVKDSGFALSSHSRLVSGDTSILPKYAKSQVSIWRRLSGFSVIADSELGKQFRKWWKMLENVSKQRVQHIGNKLRKHGRYKLMQPHRNISAKPHKMHKPLVSDTITAESTIGSDKKSEFDSGSLGPKSVPGSMDDGSTTDSASHIYQALNQYIATLHNMPGIELTVDKPALTAGTNELLVSNAGLILYHYLIPHFFQRCGLLQDGQFVDEESKLQGAWLLGRLTPLAQLEHSLPLCSLLCGLPENVQVPEIEISAEQSKELILLQQSLIDRWEKLKRTSIEQLQFRFICRVGLLEFLHNKVCLRIEGQTLDILLQSFPWAISYVKTPWMSSVLEVRWDY
jgi:Contractile injection system tape measure protein